MLEHFHLVSSVDGEVVELRQVDHSGNEGAVVLHVSQLRQVATQAGLMSSGITKTARFILEEHARLVKLIGDEIDELRDDKLGYWDELADYCPSGMEITLRLRHLAELAYSLDRSIHALMSGNRGDTHAHSVTDNGNSSVTVTLQKVGAGETATKKRGRPPKDDALSGAERQQRYRDRQRDVLSPEAMP